MSVLVFFDLLDPNIFNSFYSIFHKSCLVDLAFLKCENRNLYRNVVCEKAFKEEEVGPPKKEATFFELSSLFPEGLCLAFKKRFVRRRTTTHSSFLIISWLLCKKLFEEALKLPPRQSRKFF